MGLYVYSPSGIPRNYVLPEELAFRRTDHQGCLYKRLMLETEGVVSTQLLL